MRFDKHWPGFVILLPPLVMMTIADALWAGTRRLPTAENQAIAAQFPHNLLSTLTPIIFWGCILLFIVHAFLLRRKGWRFVWLKLVFIPIYFFIIVMLFFHVD